MRRMASVSGFAAMRRFTTMLGPTRHRMTAVCRVAPFGRVTANGRTGFDSRVTIIPVPDRRRKIRRRWGRDNNFSTTFNDLGLRRCRWSFNYICRTANALLGLSSVFVYDGCKRTFASLLHLFADLDDLINVLFSQGLEDNDGVSLQNISQSEH